MSHCLPAVRPAFAGERSSLATAGEIAFAFPGLDASPPEIDRKAGTSSPAIGSTGILPRPAISSCFPVRPRLKLSRIRAVLSGMVLGLVRDAVILVRDGRIRAGDRRVRVRNARVLVRERAILVRNPPILWPDPRILVRDRLIPASPRTIPAFPERIPVSPNLGETGAPIIPAQVCPVPIRPDAIPVAPERGEAGPRPGTVAWTGVLGSEGSIPPSKWFVAEFLLLPATGPEGPKNKKPGGQVATNDFTPGLFEIIMMSRPADIGPARVNGDESRTRPRSTLPAP